MFTRAILCSLAFVSAEQSATPVCLNHHTDGLLCAGEERQAEGYKRRRVEITSTNRPTTVSPGHELDEWEFVNNTTTTREPPVTRLRDPRHIRLMRYRRPRRAE
jgi:hypothetical protein